jgi:hypothetical protein
MTWFSWFSNSIKLVWKSFTMPERERFRKSSLNSMPSWQAMRLLKDDNTLQTFSWMHGTGKLIDELQYIDNILQLADTVNQPTEIVGHFEIALSFEESFIDSHELLVVLLDRVTEFWNLHAQTDLLDLHCRKNTDLNLDGISDKMIFLYKQAVHIFKRMRDSLLRMRSLYEDLQPETKDLIRRCSNKTQLQNSMLAQKSVQPTRSPAHFKPACGYSLESKEKSTKDRLHDLEKQLSKLQLEKDVLLNRLHDEEVVSDALEVCAVLRNILAEGSTIQDQAQALKYARDIIAPQKHVLERYSSSFENTLQAFPDVYPDTCTAEEASEFYMNMVEALDMDTTRLEMINMKFK